LSEKKVRDVVGASVAYEIEGKEYVLRPAKGGGVIAYRKAVMKASQAGPDGTRQVSGEVFDTEPYLVSLCLYQVTDKGEVPVPQSTITAWPNHLMKEMYADARRVTELDDKDTPESLEEKILKLQEEREKLLANGDAAKKGQSSTTAGSS
jgi:hypothetical protein